MTTRGTTLRTRRDWLYAFRWVVLLPLLLFALAFANFFVFGDGQVSPSVLVLPIVVGLVLGRLFQIIERQKEQLAAVNRELRHKHRQLEEQHRERLKVIRRMRRFQGSAITAIGAIHDIRNATTPIIHATSIIEAATPEDAEALGEVSSAGARINALTNRLLDALQRNATTSISRREADELVEETWQSVAALIPGVAPQLSMSHGEIAVDVEDLKQIFHNLILNAQRAAGRSLELMITGAAEGDRYCIDFHDNGPGLPDDVLSRLGELQLDEESGEIHGLGLAIVSHLATRNQGRLSVTTGAEGTTFRLCLPCA